MKLEEFLEPRSIAIIGASRKPEKVGHRIFRNLVDSKFKGALYPLNPKAKHIMGFKCYRTITEIPDYIDLAVIAVPSGIVPLVVEQCGKKGVKGIVVISAGFSEMGREGNHLEQKILAICRKYKMRMQGPNCLGIINTQSNLNASFAGSQPKSGNIAFISQSGALGSIILNWALQNRVGFTSFVSLGNEVDLNATDFLDAIGDDPQTRAIGLYIEGVKDGKRFVDVTRKVSKKKPIIALKAGTTDVGVKAVSSHTGSLAGMDTAFSAAFRKSGVLRVDTLNELFDLILAFENQPLPKGKKILIVTNGGGPGILAADACEKEGLELPILESELRESLRKSLPLHASVNNPVDVLGDADENRYKLAIEMGLRSKKVDGIIVILTPQAMTPAKNIAETLVKIRSSSKQPILATFMGLDDDSDAIMTLQKGRVPNYFFPESAAYVIKRMYDYSTLQGLKIEDPPRLSSINSCEIAMILGNVRNENRLNLTIEESLLVTKACGINVPNAKIAHSSDEAGNIAEIIGYPIVMKIVSPEILHKTDVGGIALNLTSRTDVENRFEAIMRNVKRIMPQAMIQGVLVQRMVSQGREVIAGAVRDFQFGPLIMFGLGGIYINFLRDVSYRLSPLTRSEACSMIEETKAYSLLRGVRGEAPSDISSIVDILLKISQTMERFQEIVEMEINPLFVYKEDHGSCAVDVKITINK